MTGILVCAVVTDPGKRSGDAPVPERFGRMKKYNPAAIIRMSIIAAMIGAGFLLLLSMGEGIPGGIPEPWLAGNGGCIASTGVSGASGDPHFSQNLRPSVSAVPQAVQNFCPIDPHLLKKCCWPAG